VCTISGGVVTFIGVGTCILDANQAGNASYAPATQVQQSFSVVAAASGGGGGGGGASSSGSTNAPPPSTLPSSSFGTPTSAVVPTTATTITVTSSLGGQSTTVTVPAGALPSGTVVSVYPIIDTSSLAPMVPSGQSYVIAFAVSWQTTGDTSPAATTPLTMTISDASIVAGDTIYELSSTGLVVVGTATANGTATVTFSNDPVFVVASPSTSVQVPLTITTLSGRVGTPLTLVTSGGSGTGAVTYSVTKGTAAGCVIKGGQLSATSAGTCLVTATKAADATHKAISSVATAVTLTLPARPATLSLGFAAGRSSLSSADKNLLVTLSKKLLAGASVTITGYAKADTALAHSRARAVANYLLNRVRLHVTLKTSISTSANKVTVWTTKQ
ncbi:MAG: hypothetical protein ABSE75_11780, partial [Acidimicrobiales bacterium]